MKKGSSGLPAWTGLLSLILAASVNGQVVTGFYPDVGSKGEPVRIEGSGFLGGTLVVKFSAGGMNTVVDTTAQRSSDSIIYAHVPNGAQTGPVTVQVGTTSGSSALDFTVVGLGPYIRSFTPTLGGQNDLITINGWHLTNASPSVPPAVKFNGVSASYVQAYSAGDTLQVRVPVGATSGYINVTTTGGTSNSPVPFTFTGSGPYVSGFHPNIGSPGALVYVEGVHFSPYPFTTTVAFNGKPGTNVVVVSDTLVTVNAPPGVTSGRISVSSPGGSNTNADYFYVPPVVTGFSPGAGRAGTNVVLTGTNLLGATAVLFNGVAAAFQPPTNNNILYAVAPTNANSGPVRINTLAGSYTTNVFNFLPTVSGFSPGYGPAGTTVTLYGANLNEGVSSVVFGGAAAAPVNPAFGQVSAVVPAAATNGPIVVVTTNGGFTTVSNFYLPPTITAYTPNTPPPPPGTTVNITGRHLIGTTNVTFNGWPARFTPPTSDTLLLAVVPTNVTTGPILVTTPAGTANSARFYGAPVITGFSPTNGLPSVLVTITGTNFLDASAVRFNNSDAPILSNTGGTITARLPANATTGPITVVAPAGTATSALPFTVDFASQLTVTMTATPEPVFATSNLLYTIVVANAGPFDAPNALLHDVLPSTVTLRSNTTTAGYFVINGNDLTANFGLLRISNSVTVRLTVAPQVPGPLLNTVTAASDYPDLNPDDNSASATSMVLPLPLLTLKPYSPGQWRISWPLMLTNYALQYSPMPDTNSAWLNLPTPPTIEGQERFVIEATTEPSRFYRLRK